MKKRRGRKKGESEYQYKSKQFYYCLNTKRERGGRRHIKNGLALEEIEAMSDGQ